MKSIRRNKKILVTALSLLLIVGLTVMATLAFLQDSKTLTNNATVGKIQIELKETKTDEYGNEIGDNRDGTNEAVLGVNYTLVAGKKYVKDPKITVLEGSEPTYIFVKVINELGVMEAETNEDLEIINIADQMIINGWQRLENRHPDIWYYTGYQDIEENTPAKNQPTTAQKAVSNRGIEKHSIESSNESQTIRVFESFTIATSIAEKDKTNDKKNIIVTAYAIQSMGFDYPLKAWETLNLGN